MKLPLLITLFICQYIGLALFFSLLKRFVEYPQSTFILKIVLYIKVGDKGGYHKPGYAQEEWLWGLGRQEGPQTLSQHCWSQLGPQTLPQYCYLAMVTSHYLTMAGKTVIVFIDLHRTIGSALAFLRSTGLISVLLGSQELPQHCLT